MKTGKLKLFIAPYARLVKDGYCKHANQDIKQILYTDTKNDIVYCKDTTQYVAGLCTPYKFYVMDGTKLLGELCYSCYNDVQEGDTVSGHIKEIKDIAKIDDDVVVTCVPLKDLQDFNIEPETILTGKVIQKDRSDFRIDCDCGKSVVVKRHSFVLTKRDDCRKIFILNR